MKSVFGGDTRAVDGITVTFEADGERWSKQFVRPLRFELTNEEGRSGRMRPYGPLVMEQAVAYADEREAMIVCISSPETIVRDLQGTRAELEVKAGQKTRSDRVLFPEVVMLSKVGRTDLFIQPKGFGQEPGNIRQVRQRRPTHSGSQFPS